MEYSISALSKNNEEYGLLNIRIPENEFNFNKCEFVNLKVIEKLNDDSSYFIILTFFDIANRKKVAFELPMSDDKRAIKILKKFILNVKDKVYYYLQVSCEDGQEYILYINSESLEVITVDKV